jgi:hypothetical protein
LEYQIKNATDRHLSTENSEVAKSRNTTHDRAMLGKGQRQLRRIFQAGKVVAICDDL